MEKLRLLANKVRCLQRIIRSDKFIEIFPLCDPEEINKFIANINPDGLRLFIKNFEDKPLESMSLRELKHKGQIQNIYNWSRLSKAELIFELGNYHGNIKTSSRINLFDAALHSIEASGKADDPTIRVA